MRESPTADPVVVSSARAADAATAVVDHIKGPEVVQSMIDVGASKASLSAGNIFVRGMYGGALLAFATSISFYANAQTHLPIVGALLFPVGFAIITLLGVDLITGYFALTPLAVIHKRLSFGGMLRAWVCVWAGNLAGSLLYVLMMWVGFTMAGHEVDKTGLALWIQNVSQAKTHHFQQFGTIGALTAFVKAMLCNWMVTLGVVLPMASRSAIGKVLGTYIPIFMFFAMGYEHMVVNMFIIPAGMLFGIQPPAPLPLGTPAPLVPPPPVLPISWSDFWIGNELPVTLGNFVGGFLFTAAALGYVYYTRRVPEDPIIQPTVRSARL